jgi:hypothetical protein
MGISHLTLGEMRRVLIAIDELAVINEHGHILAPEVTTKLSTLRADVLDYMADREVAESRSRIAEHARRANEVET